MKRHAPDWTSFIAGITFCGIAIAYLLSELDDRSLQIRWIVPVVLIGLGVAGLAGTLVRARATPAMTAHDAPSNDTTPPSADSTPSSADTTPPSAESGPSEEA